MKCSAQKCQHCKEFYLPDRRNLHHQRYCAEPACRRQSKSESQRRWVQKPENQNYFSGPQNSQRVKGWRKRNPGYWRKKNPPLQEPLQDLCTTQVTQDEEVKTIEISDALQDVLLMQLAVMVGLISIMTQPMKTPSKSTCPQPPNTPSLQIRTPRYNSMHKYHDNWYLCF